LIVWGAILYFSHKKNMGRKILGEMVGEKKMWEENLRK
jgi:hypothetical protein